MSNLSKNQLKAISTDIYSYSLVRDKNLQGTEFEQLQNLLQHYSNHTQVPFEYNVIEKITYHGLDEVGKQYDLHMVYIPNGDEKQAVSLKGENVRAADILEVLYAELVNAYTRLEQSLHDEKSEVIDAEIVQ